MATTRSGVRARLRTLAGERRRFGYQRLGILPEREGMRMNGLFRAEVPAVRRRRRRKRATGTRAPLALQLTRLALRCNVESTGRMPVRNFQMWFYSPYQCRPIRANGAVLLLTMLSASPANAQEDQDNTAFGLAEVIRTVHEELAKSQTLREEAGMPALFETSRFELELNVVVTSSAEGDAGIDIDVVGIGGFNLGGSGSLRTEEIQKVKLTFETPEADDGDNGPIGRRPAFSLPQTAGNLELIKALNALESLTSHHQFSYPDFFPAENVQRALEELRGRRTAVLKNIYGTDLYEEYMEIRGDNFQEELSKRPRDERERLAEIDSAFEARYAQ